MIVGRSLVRRLIVLSLVWISYVAATAQQTILNGPAGSGSFGTSVVVLSNGNYVVTDPTYDDGSIIDVGAVYLYNGSNNALISTLRGSTANDQVGSNGVTALSGGNYVVNSPFWDNGAVTEAGAVTWCDGNSGINGLVSSSNSLVGSTASDFIGFGGITVLPGGNYLVRSINWDNGAAGNAGAVTWGNGTTGVRGEVSSSNSLVGGTANNLVGGSITVLANGNYVVISDSWDNGPATNAGAVTWGNGTTGISGVVSSSNSLVGSTSNDNVGSGGITALPGGNYVVVSVSWDNGSVVNAGAVTWGNGSTGISGVISSSNSLVGAVTSGVGNGGVTVLSNGNYVVRSDSWPNGAATEAGAVTWGSGSTGVSGVVSSSNSLVGSAATNLVGNGGITVLGNGNYLVRSSSWDNGAASNAGAVTWGNGSTGTVGVVSNSNSLIGSTANDAVGSAGITVLTNNNYVVRTTNWDNGGVRNVGAVTWGNGSTGTSGVISLSNSLVGAVADDQVGFSSVVALSNGHYVVGSTAWDNGAATNAGAVTWGNGTAGTSGVVSSSNSLVGTTLDDRIGTAIVALSNGNYVASSNSWDNGAVQNAGAVTWGNGTTGTTGVVSSSNSLVGSTLGDVVGNNGVFSLSNGNYVVSSGVWDNGSTSNVGAITWGNGATGISGVISSSNSLVGSTSNDQIGNSGIITLSNGNYVVNSPFWDNGSADDAGAITWANGSTGITGVINSSNSLVGSQISDQVGNSGVTALANGNYVVSSPFWEANNFGAVTWGNGSTGTVGVVSSSNSLVGSTFNDRIGASIVTLSNGNYVVRSSGWDNGAATNAGAASLGNGASGLSGVVSTCNSITGSATNSGGSIVAILNPVYNTLIGSISPENRVVVFNPLGQALASENAVASVDINGTNAVQLVTNSGCSILGIITPNGTSPVSGSTTARVRFAASMPTATPPFVARHYEVSPAVNASSATARITLFFTQQEFTDFNNLPNNGLNLPAGSADADGKANLRIEQRGGTSSDGTGLPDTYSGSITTIDPTDDDIIWNESLSRWEVSFNVIGFSGFFVKTSLFVLPLTLLDFNGIWLQDDALLQWKTANEVGTDHFVVERSIDGKDFMAVGTIWAKNSNGTHIYQYADARARYVSAPSSMLYYRLRLLDKDSRSTYSNIVALPLNQQEAINVFPNPASDRLMITLSATRQELLQFRIVDVFGRVAQQRVWQMPGSTATLAVDVSQLPKGMYFVELLGTTIRERRPFLRQ